MWPGRIIVLPLRGGFPSREIRKCSLFFIQPIGPECFRSVGAILPWPARYLLLNASSFQWRSCAENRNRGCYHCTAPFGERFTARRAGRHQPGRHEHPGADSGRDRTGRTDRELSRLLEPAQAGQETGSGLAANAPDGGRPSAGRPDLSLRPGRGRPHQGIRRDRGTFADPAEHRGGLPARGAAIRGREPPGQGNRTLSQESGGPRVHQRPAELPRGGGQARVLPDQVGNDDRRRDHGSGRSCRGLGSQQDPGRAGRQRHPERGGVYRCAQQGQDPGPDESAGRG